VQLDDLSARRPARLSEDSRRLRDVKIVQVVPVADDKPSLKNLLKQTERRLRGGPTAFVRRREGRWVHVKHPGWINWDLSRGGILVAEIQSKRAAEEWKLLQAFVGYLDRHLGEYIDTITIIYR
jgi:hypothetical protein